MVSGRDGRTSFDSLSRGRLRLLDVVVDPFWQQFLVGRGPSCQTSVTGSALRYLVHIQYSLVTVLGAQGHRLDGRRATADSARTAIRPRR